MEINLSWKAWQGFDKLCSYIEKRCIPTVSPRYGDMKFIDQDGQRGATHVHIHVGTSAKDMVHTETYNLCEATKYPYDEDDSYGEDEEDEDVKFSNSTLVFWKRPTTRTLGLLTREQFASIKELDQLNDDSWQTRDDSNDVQWANEVDVFVYLNSVG